MLCVAASRTNNDKNCGILRILPCWFPTRGTAEARTPRYTDVRRHVGMEKAELQPCFYTIHSRRNEIASAWKHAGECSSQSKGATPRQKETDPGDIIISVLFMLLAMRLNLAAFFCLSWLRMRSNVSKRIKSTAIFELLINWVLLRLNGDE